MMPLLPPSSRGGACLAVLRRAGRLTAWAGLAIALVVNNAVHGRLLACLAPKGRYTQLPGVGHMIHHAAPDRVIEAIDRLSA